MLWKFKPAYPPILLMIVILIGSVHWVILVWHYDCELSLILSTTCVVPASKTLIERRKFKKYSSGRKSERNYRFYGTCITGKRKEVAVKYGL